MRNLSSTPLAAFIKLRMLKKKRQLRLAVRTMQPDVYVDVERPETLPMVAPRAVADRQSPKLSQVAPIRREIRVKSRNQRQQNRRLRQRLRMLAMRESPVVPLHGATDSDGGEPATTSGARRTEEEDIDAQIQALLAEDDVLISSFMSEHAADYGEL